MDRPPRNRKNVNYSDFLDDDDEDFATVKALQNKKARASVKEPHCDNNRETLSNSPKEIINSTRKGSTERVSLDEKLYKRDLEAALSLSLQQSMDKVEEPLANAPEDCQPPVLTHCSVDGSCLEYSTSNHLPRDSPPVLSNCSVDVSCLGLDQVTSEQTPSTASSRQKKNPINREWLLQDENDSAGGEDYKPQNTPDSDLDFSDPDASEDEEFTIRRKQEKKKTSRKEKKTAKKEKYTQKPKSKTIEKSAAASKKALNVSPGVAQSVPARKKSPITPPTPKLALCSSPAGGRLPKWNPPGLLRSSPTSCQSGPIKSPGLGLRLGLSRLARVKPLHPNATAH